jgi:hypothetical protein
MAHAGKCRGATGDDGPQAACEGEPISTPLSHLRPLLRPRVKTVHRIAALRHEPRSPSRIRRPRPSSLVLAPISPRSDGLMLGSSPLGTRLSPISKGKSRAMTHGVWSRPEVATWRALVAAIIRISPLLTPPGASGPSLGRGSGHGRVHGGVVSSRKSPHARDILRPAGHFCTEPGAVQSCGPPIQNAHCPSARRSLSAASAGHAARLAPELIGEFQAPDTGRSWTGDVCMASSRDLTLRDLILAVIGVAASEQQTLATVADPINSGRVRRCGESAGATVDLSATEDAAACSPRIQPGLAPRLRQPRLADGLDPRPERDVPRFPGQRPPRLRVHRAPPLPLSRALLHHCSNTTRPAAHVLTRGPLLRHQSAVGERRDLDPGDHHRAVVLRRPHGP